MNEWIVFFGKNNKRYNYNGFLNNKFSVMHCGQVYAYYKREDHFADDQVFWSTETQLCILDGVLLNLSELKTKYQLSNSLDVLLHMKKENPLFFAEFRGPFSGVSFDIGRDELIAYGNQTGDAPVFYYSDDDIFIVSNDMNLIVDFLYENAMAYTFDEQAALYALTYGFMLDERTMITEISRLTAGNYLRVSKSEFQNCSYHRFSFEEKDISFEDAIEAVDAGFRMAVKRCFDKDREYGIENHLADMSGGLDSRMTNWVARDMGYENIVNISYGQSASDELKIASAVSRKLGNQFVFQQLDEVSFVYDIDQIVNYNYGLTYYCGLTGAKNLLSSLNREKFGLEHTGQLGDIIVGSYGNTSEHVLPSAQIDRNSRLIEYSPDVELLNSYRCREEFSLSNRGFRSVISTHLTRRHYFYTTSPFIDPDFIQICCNIPMRYRANHKLYWAWVDKKYPAAGQMASTRSRSTKKIKLYFEGGCRRIRRLGRKVLHTVGIVKNCNSANNMNPFDYWYESDKRLRDFIESYYRETSKLMEPYKQTTEYIKKMMASSRTMDKLLALTVLGALKRYFSKKGNE